MRKPSKKELGILVGAVIATGVTHADELEQIIIEGYQDHGFTWYINLAYQYDPSPGKWSRRRLFREPNRSYELRREHNERSSNARRELHSATAKQYFTCDSSSL